jgi:hypothetical protein
MNETWNRIACAGGSCPQWRQVPDGCVMLRTTKPFTGVVRFTATEWAALIAAAKNGDLDQDTP